MLTRVSSPVRRVAGLGVLQFDDVLPVCEAAGRWSFLCVIAPLRLPGGTGSPINPIAVL